MTQFDEGKNDEPAAGLGATAGIRPPGTTQWGSEALKNVVASASYLHTREENQPTRVVVAAGLLLRVRELLLRELDSALNEVGTSHPRHQVLSIVCHSSSGLQLGEIALRAAVHPTTMTSTIDRLERDGFIERRPDPNDRRGTLAIATQKGRESYERGRVALAAIDYGFGGMADDSVYALVELLDGLAQGLERHDASA